LPSIAIHFTQLSTTSEGLHSKTARAISLSEQIQMSEEREEEEELREPPPPPTQHRSARVPVPNSKFVEDRDDEEEVVKIERKPRTKVGKRAKIKSSQLRAKKSFENLVNNNDDDEEEEEEEPAATTTRLVQPSKILIPEDGQQPKKWRLADQRRYECKQFCVHVFKCDHVGNSSRTTLSLSVFSLFSKRRRRRRRRRAKTLSVSLVRGAMLSFFLSFFLSFSNGARERDLSFVRI